jgi:O-antigen/teichoic acid export membrane protein
MALFLPIRGLSGYFVGQTLPSLLTMGMAFFGLRSVLGRAVKAESYWRSDGRQIVAYMVPYGILASLGIMLGAVELFVIRHRLPDLESAAYYMISRFAETGAYMGLTLTFVAFPLIAERHEKGETSDRLLWQSLGGALAAGLVLALLFSISAPWLFSRVGAWRPYTPFVPYLAVLTLIHAFRIATACFITHEMACRRFAFLLYYGSLCVIEMFTLYGLTGYRFFSPYLPAAWLSALEAFNPCRLSVVLGVMSLFTLLSFGAALLDALRQRKTRISVQ